MTIPFQFTISSSRSILWFWLGFLPRFKKISYGFCIFVGYYLVSWPAKKQSTISRSSAEVEYWSFAVNTSEIVWIRQLVRDFGITTTFQLFYFVTIRMQFTLPPIQLFHERAKHIEIDCHFIFDKVLKDSSMPIHSKYQLGDMFIKPLPSNLPFPSFVQDSCQRHIQPILSGPIAISLAE